MNLITDLHIHSKYARATSKALDFASLEKNALLKGIHLLGTGDFTHPEWRKEISANLADVRDGIYKSRTGFPFICQTEISLIYSQGGKGRRVHNLVLAPSLEVVDQITEALKKRGRVDYDGRPIFNIPCPEFVEMMVQISKDIEVIPAHAWTPWFSIFGSMSGFDSIKDCFLDKTKYIHAIETGLSSDPAMNWRLSQLDNITLVSFSDAHSAWPWRLGRECTIFDAEKLTYDEIIKAIRENKVVETIEFFPEEGKYHWDGHRNCNVSMQPADAIRQNNLCQKCRQKLTIGVLHRVEQLADRAAGEKPKNAKPFRNLIPLSEVIAAVRQAQPFAKKVWQDYNELLTCFGTELDVLLNIEKNRLAEVVDEKIADVIVKIREQKVNFKPGYDGVYGVPIIDSMELRMPGQEIASEKKSVQKGLTDF